MTYPSLCICSHFGFFILARTRVETEKACLICMICCPINAGLFPPVLCEHGDTESMACLQPLTVLLPARAHSHDPGSPFCLQLPDHVYKNKQKKSIQPQSWMQLKCFLGDISLCQQIAYHLSVVLWSPSQRGAVCCWEWGRGMLRRITCLKMWAQALWTMLLCHILALRCNFGGMIMQKMF